MLKAEIYTDYSVIEMNNARFFVIGRCLNGSRHYSEYLSLSKAFEIFDIYSDIVEYFGGGTVEIWADVGYDILIRQKSV